MAENEAHFREGQPIVAGGFSKCVADIGHQPTVDRDQITVFDRIYSTTARASPRFPGYLGSVPTPQDTNALSLPSTREAEEVLPVSLNPSSIP